MVVGYHHLRKPPYKYKKYWWAWGFSEDFHGVTRNIEHITKKLSFLQLISQWRIWVPKLAGNGTLIHGENCGDRISWFLFRKQHPNNKSCEDFPVSFDSVSLEHSSLVFFFPSSYISIFKRILVEMILFGLQSFFQDAEASKSLEEGDGRLGIPEWGQLTWCNSPKQ